MSETIEQSSTKIKPKQNSKIKEKPLRLAIQKKGRLSEDTLKLLSDCGIQIKASSRALVTGSVNFPLELLWVRDDDIPELVSKGACDAGICGENVWLEASAISNSKQYISNYMNLGFARCRLEIAIKESESYNSIRDLNGKKIATSYPGLLNDYLLKHNVKADVVFQHGAVEIAPKLDLADAICDLVSTGYTLKANGLKAVECILQSEAQLKINKDLSADKLQILSRLKQRITGVRSASESKYIMLHAPKDKLNDIVELLPGSESPSVMALQDSTRVAVHAVCREEVFWETMEKLKSLGASSILVLPLEKMMV